MAIAIRIPAPDPTTEQVRVVRWLKEKGQEVSANEPLFEIETDKGVMEVESFADGILLEVLAEVGQTVSVSKVVAIIGQEGEDFSEFLE